MTIGNSTDGIQLQIWLTPVMLSYWDKLNMGVNCPLILFRVLTAEHKLIDTKKCWTRKYENNIQQHYRNNQNIDNIYILAYNIHDETKLQ